MDPGQAFENHGPNLGLTQQFEFCFMYIFILEIPIFCMENDYQCCNNLIILSLEADQKNRIRILTLGTELF